MLKLSQNITRILHEKLHHMNQEDLEYLIKRGFIDEASALVLFQQILSNTEATKNIAYSLKNDLYIGNFIPLVYSLHVCFMSLSFAFSLVHKHFTLRISRLLYVLIKLAEIMFFYFFALYLQSNECLYFSSGVHVIFDLTVYHLLLDILQMLGFNQDDFKFDVSKINRGTRDKLKGKIIFNGTLLAIAYVSSMQFLTVFSSFFLYFHGFFLVIRML